MSTNCYDVENEIAIVGTCFERMQPKAYSEIKKLSKEIFSVCLESTHVNMVITKLIGMICRNEIKKITFATVDQSPHCVQLHYIEQEIRKAINIKNIQIEHYVAVDNMLYEISSKSIELSKSLYKLKDL